MAHSHAAQLQASNVSFQRGPDVIIKDFSHTVGAADRTGLVGPNGVGKSTLLQLLAGERSPSSGSISRHPSNATVGLLDQELNPPHGQTILGLLAERTGVASAQVELEAAAAGLASAEAAPERYDLALSRFLSLGGPDLEARCGSVLASVGLGEQDTNQLASSLSGGEQAKVGLAAIILSRFDVLLLDEPTNNLDAAGLVILETFLVDSSCPFIVVSHDRRFMQRIVNGVIDIDPHLKTSSYVRGSWNVFRQQSLILERQKAQEFEDFVSKREHLLHQRREMDRRLAKGIAAAKNPSDNDKSLRNRQLERTEQRTGKATQLDRAIDRLETVDKPWQEWQLQFRIGEVARSGDLVAQLLEAKIRLGSFQFGPVDLALWSGDRLAISGPNGSGKSTLIRLLLAQLTVDSGQQQMGSSVVVGRLGQARRNYSGFDSLLRRFSSRTGAPANELRSVLAKFGLAKEHLHRPLNQLSPGERTRAGLAEFQLMGVNTLVLDEPTNHLDLAAIEQLEQALANFAGTLIIVSHDRAFMDAIDVSRTISLDKGRIIDCS